jgi:hypothetical protein
VLIYLDNKKIDRKKWDACVDRAPQNLPYGFSWYLDIVAENWSGLVLNDYEAVMPLPFKNKLGLKIIYQPFFTQQLGVFGKAGPHEFLNSIPTKFRHIHTNFNYGNAFEKKVAGLKEQINLVVDLNSKSLSKKFSENCKRNIKKSEAGQLSLEKCEPAELIKLFRKTRGASIAHLKEKNYKTLLDLIAEFKKRKMAEITGIFDEQKKLVGGAVILHYRNRNIFFFSAQSESGKNKAAMYFFLNDLIAKKSGSPEVLDFEGSNDTGLSRFYRGFGAVEENYSSYTVNRLPLPLRLLKK